MGIEIERKFLVDGDAADWGPAVTEVRAWEIRQGYVTPPGSDPEVRVRHTRPLAPGGEERTDAGAPETDGASAAADDVVREDAAPGVTRQLTTKAAVGDGTGGAVTRVEVEVDVDEGAFLELWGVTAGRRIEKRRTEYALDLGAGGRFVFTVDRFGGALQGLQLAEIEFADAAASRAFAPPAFLRLEVTEDRRYRNAELAVLDAPPAEVAADRLSPRPSGHRSPATYEIAADEPLGEGLRRSARDQLGGAAEVLERADGDDLGKAIHDARKRIKRTRALLRLARPAVGRKVARGENAALRDAAASLSAARDADVLVQTVDALAERYAGRLPATTFEIVRHELSGAGGPRAVPSVEEALGGLRAVLARVESWPLDRAGRDDVLAGAGVAYAAGRAQLPKPGDEPSADELHEWRKRVKDLWYHGLLLQNAWPAVLRAQAEEAHHLSEILGDDHDLSVLRDRLCAVPLDDPTADVDGLIELIDRRRAELLTEALDLGCRVYAEKPDAHARRLRRYVRAWQEPSVA